MAQNYAAPAFVAVALLLFVAAIPTAYGVVPIPLGLLKLNASVCCSDDGNCNGTTPALPEVVVKLNCTNFLGASVQVGQGVTDVNGTVNISVYKILNFLGITLNSILTGKQLPCAAFFTLPLNQIVCPVLNTTTGLVVGLPVFLNSVLATEVYSTVQYFFIKTSL